MREKAHQRGLNASYLEGDFDNEDDNAISLSAIKKQYKQGAKRKYCHDAEIASRFQLHISVVCMTGLARVTVVCTSTVKLIPDFKLPLDAVDSSSCFIA
jgi:hypothetical protein